MIAPQPFFEPRGTPISVYQRIRALSDLGHKVDLVTYHIGQDVVFPKLSIHRIPWISAIQRVQVGPSGAKLLLDVLVIFKAFHLLLLNRYDAIHSHEEASFFSMFLSSLFRIPHIYDMHSVLSKQLQNFSFGNKPLFIKMFTWLEERVINTAQSVIVVGNDLEQYVKSVNPDCHVVLIENVAIQSHERLIQQEFTDQIAKDLNLSGKIPIVYTGTFERYQGLDMALDCATHLIKDFPNLLFVFVGAKNTQREELAHKAKILDLDRHVTIVDAVSPEKSMAFLACSSVIISPRGDGLSTPLKLYSYMASGKPIVATNIPAHTQVLTKDMAVLVEPTSHAFAEGITWVLKNYEQAKILGSNAHKFAEENFRFDRYVEKMGSVYQFREVT